MRESTPRVVVTGLGAITPIGLTVADFWRNLTAGVSGAGPVTLFDASSFPTRIAAEVKGFEPRNYMEAKEARRMARFSQFAVAAARQALEDSGLQIKSENAGRIGVVINTGGGGFGAVETETKVLAEKGPDRVSPFFVTCLMPSMCACYVSILFGIKGPVITSVAACASGTYAMVEALRLLRRGDADAVVAGGTEAGITPIGFAGLGAVRAMSTRNAEPTKACRPFDRDRDGLVFGEGAGVMVLETLDHARQRDARVYGEVLGGSMTGDAYHITAPDPNGEGAVLAMARALEDGGLQPEEVDYISAHGTATKLNDVVETMAIKRVFGEHAYRLAISSTKSMLGHLLGGAGAVATIAAVLSTREGIVPPTINLDNPDPECDLDYVPLVARRQPVEVAMVNAFGFGGQNSVLVVRRYTM